MTFNKVMRLIKHFLLVSFVTACCSLSVFGKGIENLKNYLGSNGSMVNVNKSALIKDQTGGYMTGGSILIRGPRPEILQPLTMETPRYNIDACTGSADFRFGGLSYISGAQFTAFLKKMATASGAYGVKMLLKTSCPQCEDIVSYLETVARNINGMTMDQCQAAQKISEGVFGKLVNAGQQQCLMKRNIDNYSKDLYAASEYCKDAANKNDNTGEEDELKSLLGDQFNLVWKALSKGGAGDRQFLEMIMSVSGTLIGKKVEGKFHFSHKPSLILNNQMLEEYIGVSSGSSKLKRYKCNEYVKCLEVSEEEVSLTRDDTLYGNISRILRSLAGKILEGDGSKITAEEEAVITFSSIPLINLIEMETASKTKTDDLLVRVSEFVEVICYDVITNYLTQMVSKAQSAVDALEHVQITDAKPIKAFSERSEKVKSFLKDAKFAAFKRLQIITQVKERLTMQEQAFEHGFSRFMQQVQ